MIAEIKPYLEYKESGLPWLGQVPEHWSISRSKRLFSARKDLAMPEDVQLSATQAYGVIPQAEFEEKVGRRVVKISMHLEQRRHVERDDFVVSMRSFQGGLERAWASGAIRSSYVVLKPEPGVDIGFFAYLFKSHGYIRALQATADFIRDGQDLNFSNFCRVDLPVVPADEQAAIVRFLDWVTGRLERAIRAKRKVIALLQEQKQAIIHCAVTRGLDPDVPLKPSGIPWLGKIPVHWRTSRISRLATRIGDGLHGTPEYVDQSPYYFINGNNLVHGDIHLKSSTRCVGEAEFKKHMIALDDSSVLMSINGTIGNVAYYRGESIILGKSAAYINCGSGLARPFLVFFLQSPDVVSFLRQEVTGTTIFNLSLASIRSLPIALPSLDEQMNIVVSIEDRIAPVNTTISHLEREIELLREYRTRLVADVVTGKLDVRAAAASLPVEVGREEVVDDGEVGVEDEREESGEEIEP